jgi:hypothetical protein
MTAAHVPDGDESNAGGGSSTECMRPCDFFKGSDDRAAERAFVSYEPDWISASMNLWGVWAEWTPR